MAQQDGDQVLPLKLVNLNEGLPFIMGDAHGGKGLFATRDLSEGELLFTEPVFSFQLKNFVGAENHPVPYSLCSHCVRFLGPIETQLGLVCEYVGKKLPAEVCVGFHFSLFSFHTTLSFLICCISICFLTRW